MKKAIPEMPENIQAIIKAAVNEGIAAGRQAARQERTPYQKTEKRLYALPALIKKVSIDEEELRRLESIDEVPYEGEIPGHSRDLVRLSSGGSRLSAQEKLEAIIRNLKKEIATDRYEIDTMRQALQQLEEEYYYSIIPAKYFEKRSDDDIAKELCCDDRTVRRQKSRLITELSVLLYGTQALL